MAVAAEPQFEAEQSGAGARVVASSIRSLRQRKGWTVAALADKVRLDKGYLSRLERGEKSPSVGTLLKIAEALGVQIGHLFGETTVDEAITVVRSSELLSFSKGKSPKSQIILPAGGHRRLSAFMIEPGLERESSKTEHPGDEFLYVLEGVVEVAFPDRTITLDAGDCLHFDGHLRHQLRRVGSESPKVLLVVAQDLPRASAEA